MKKKSLFTFTSLVSILFMGIVSCGGSTSKHVHTFSSEWTYDETNHWHAATCGHNVVSEEAAHNFSSRVIEPTYEERGYTLHECTVCDYEYKDNYVDPLEHNFSTVWAFNDDTHWHNCIDEGYESLKGSEAEHTYDNGVVTNPTYDSGGYTTYTCTVCGHSYIGDLTPQLKHNYETSWTKDETGHWHACTDTGFEELKGEFNAHSYGSWVIDTPASKDQDGIRHHVCSVCEYSESESFPYSGEKASRVYLPTPATTLFNGYTYTLSPTVVPNNVMKNVKYVIEDKDVLSVSGNIITATGVGTSLIYAYNDDDNDDIKDDDEAFDVMAFTVSEADPNKYVTVEENVTIKVGESKKLTYSQMGISATGLEYGFYSDDESICTISSGTVKGHKAGTTRVSVSLQGYRDYCTVTVVDNKDVSGVRASEIVSEENALLNKGDSRTLTYQILPLGAVDTLATVSSNNERVVKVNNDKSLTALNGGSAVVTLTTSNNKFTRVLVTVKDNANNETSYYNNYYGNLTWENGQDLKAKLHAIISKDVHPLKYNTPNWETNQVADQDLYDYSYVNGVYNDTPINKTSTNEGWQREHAFAASLMSGFSTGEAVKSLGRSTDFHNLFAASAGANGSRGNKNLGYVNPESIEYSTKENCSFTRNAFEPNDVDKGRLARAIFYMSVMYNTPVDVDVAETWTYRGDDVETHSTKTKSVHVNSTQQPLEIVDGYVDYNRISINEFMSPNKEENVPYVNYYLDLVRQEKPSLETSDYDLFRETAYEKYLSSSMPYSIGYFSDLLKWNSFAVDYQEMQHNESVYSYNCSAGAGKQNNRNPFVDYPQLVDYIYGDLKDQPGSLSELTPSYLTLEMDKDEIHHYAVESEALPAFESGTKPTVDDFNLKAIKNDLSEGVLDKTKISVEDYTFTDEDVATGKVITITTDKNTLLVPCKVTSASVITFDTCTFHYKPSTGNKSDYTGSEKSWVANFGGTKFDVKFGAWSSASGYFKNNNNPGGVTIGSGTNKLVSLTFESQQSYNNINAAFFYAAGSAAAAKITYKVSVNGVLKFSGVMSGSTFDTYGQEFAPCSGKIKFEFTNVEGIKFCGLAFNY